MVRDLDLYLSEQDGPEHAFYAQFNKIENLKYVVVAYHQDQAVGCGAIKPFNESSMEVKRMYVKPEFRGQKIASRLLVALEEFESDVPRRPAQLYRFDQERYDALLREGFEFSL